MSKYGVFSGPNAGKYGPDKTPYLESFRAVQIFVETSLWKSCHKNSLCKRLLICKNVNCKVTPLANVFSINVSICHFLIICFKDTCTEGSELTAAEWFYSLLNLFLTSYRHSLAQIPLNNLTTKTFRVLL